MVHVKTQMDSEQMRIWLKKQQQVCSPKELKRERIHYGWENLTMIFETGSFPRIWQILSKANSPE